MRFGEEPHKPDQERRNGQQDGHRVDAAADCDVSPEGGVVTKQALSGDKNVPNEVDGSRHGRRAGRHGGGEGVGASDCQRLPLEDAVAEQVPSWGEGLSRQIASQEGLGDPADDGIPFAGLDRSRGNRQEALLVAKGSDVVDDRRGEVAPGEVVVAKARGPSWEEGRLSNLLAGFY